MPTKGKKRPVAARNRSPDADLLKQAKSWSVIWKSAISACVTLGIFYSAYAAWNNLGWWVPAGQTYVDTHIKEAIRPIGTKLDDLNTSALWGRIESLTGNREAAMAQRADLELKMRVNKDPAYIQLVTAQMRQVDDRIKAIDEKLTDTKAELKRAQGKGQ